jgi:hypothetical protein
MKIKLTSEVQGLVHVRARGKSKVLKPESMSRYVVRNTLLPIHPSQGMLQPRILRELNVNVSSHCDLHQFLYNFHATQNKYLKSS